MTRIIASTDFGGILFFLILIAVTIMRMSLKSKERERDSAQLTDLDPAALGADDPEADLGAFMREMAKARKRGMDAHLAASGERMKALERKAREAGIDPESRRKFAPQGRRYPHGGDSAAGDYIDRLDATVAELNRQGRTLSPKPRHYPRGLQRDQARQPAAANEAERRARAAADAEDARRARLRKAQQPAPECKEEECNGARRIDLKGKLTREKLREAIITKEILQPPLALRKDIPLWD